MDFTLGLLSAVVFFAVYSWGVRDGQKRSKPDPVEVDEESQRKAKQIHEHFQALMNYDVDVAMQRKKVT